MDSLGALVVGAIALEAVIHILRNTWDEGARSEWDITTIAYYVIPIVTLFAWADDTNIAGSLGLDLNVDAIGTIVTALAAGRVAMWVGSFYKKTAA